MRPTLLCCYEILFLNLKFLYFKNNFQFLKNAPLTMFHCALAVFVIIYNNFRTFVWSFKNFKIPWTALGHLWIPFSHKQCFNYVKFFRPDKKFIGSTLDSTWSNFLKKFDPCFLLLSSSKTSKAALSEFSKEFWRKFIGHTRHQSKKYLSR